jgi:hypothetical protein
MLTCSWINIANVDKIISFKTYVFLINHSLQHTNRPNMDYCVSIDATPSPKLGPRWLQLQECESLGTWGYVPNTQH